MKALGRLLASRGCRPAATSSSSQQTARVRLPLRFFLEHLHCDRHEPIQLVIGGTRQQRLCPEVILTRRVSVEQTAEERHEGNPLELRTAARLFAIVVRAEQGLE